MDDFQSFSPSSWFAKGLEVLIQPRPKKALSPARIDPSWRIVLVASVVNIGIAFSAEAIAFDPRESSIAFSVPGRADVRDGTTEDAVATRDDRSFADLFSAYRTGRPLLPTDIMRELARSAVDAKPNSDVEAWAQKLASDVAKAND